MKKLLIGLALCCAGGCSTINGAAKDTEGMMRWVKERTQPVVDNQEMDCIAHALERQNRIIERGVALSGALRR